MRVSPCWSENTPHHGTIYTIELEYKDEDDNVINGYD